MADMTSHRATVTMPTRDRRRGPSASQGSSSPPATPAASGASQGPASATRPPGEPAACASSANGAPAEVAERYLAPALKAAAAARARTARIRAAAWAAAAGPARPYPREWLLAPPDQSPTALLPSPTPARELPPAEATTAWPMSGLTAIGLAGLPAVLPSRGLSVAEAAGASRIAFRPLRRPSPANPARPPAEPPAARPIPTAPGKPAAPAKAVAPPTPSRALTTPAPPAKAVAPATPTAPAKAVAPTAPAKAVTRPGASRLLPAEAVRRAVPERPPRQQRFAKTIAELQRYQAAVRPSEPWGNVVPRPAVPQSNAATSDSRWSRLWSRR